MPGNLSSEQLAAILQSLNSGGAWAGSTDPQWLPNSEAYVDGRGYLPMYGASIGGGGVDDPIVPPLSGWWGYDRPEDLTDIAQLNGTNYDIYGADGARTGQGTFQGLKSDGWRDAIIPALMMAAPFAAGMFPAVNSALSFGANPVLSGASATGAAQAAGAAGAIGAGTAGTGAAGYGVAGDAYLPGAFGAAGDAAMPGALSIGGSLGAAAPLTGLDAYLVSGAAGAAGSAGAGAGSGAAGAGAAGAAGATGAGSAAAAGGGLLSSLGSVGSTLAGAGGWLAPLLGAALGSQPTTNETNSTKSMDPRMDALVYGDGGFLNNARDWYDTNKSGMNDAMRGALAQNRSLLQDPATAQGYRDMASTGQGLLSRAPAGNPFTAAQRPQFGSNLLSQYMGGGLLGAQQPSAQGAAFGDQPPWIQDIQRRAFMS